MASFGDLSRKIHDDGDPGGQEAAMVSVVELAAKHANRWKMPEFLDALQGIVRLLLRDECPGPQTFAAWAVANLSSAHAPEHNKERMASFPQVLSGLVRLASGAAQEQQQQDSSAQEEAVRALRNLACAQENSQTISVFPDAVPSLLHLLFEDSRPSLQIQATVAVLNLIGNAMVSLEGINAVTGDLDGHDDDDDLEFPGVLKCLVGLWFSDATRAVQVEAIKAIVDLVERTLVNPDASAKDGNMEKIADFPDALLLLLGSFMSEIHGVEEGESMSKRQTDKKGKGKMEGSS